MFASSLTEKKRARLDFKQEVFHRDSRTVPVPQNDHFQTVLVRKSPAARSNRPVPDPGGLLPEAYGPGFHLTLSGRVRANVPYPELSSVLARTVHPVHATQSSPGGGGKFLNVLLIALFRS